MIWEVQKAEHNRKKQEYTDNSFAMAKAGPPLLQDVVLGNKISESAGPLSGARIMQGSQK